MHCLLFYFKNTGSKYIEKTSKGGVGVFLGSYTKLTLKTKSLHTPRYTLTINTRSLHTAKHTLTLNTRSLHTPRYTLTQNTRSLHNPRHTLTLNMY